MWVAGILVVLAVVTEEILREGAVEDATELLCHLQIGFDVDTKPLEFIAPCSAKAFVPRSQCAEEGV